MAAQDSAEKGDFSRNEFKDSSKHQSKSLLGNTSRPYTGKGRENFVISPHENRGQPIHIEDDLLKTGKGHSTSYYDYNLSPKHQKGTTKIEIKNFDKRFE
jgi:hypothetical protein